MPNKRLLSSTRLAVLCSLGCGLPGSEPLARRPRTATPQLKRLSADALTTVTIETTDPVVPDEPARSDDAVGGPPRRRYGPWPAKCSIRSTPAQTRRLGVARHGSVARRRSLRADRSRVRFRSCPRAGRCRGRRTIQRTSGEPRFSGRRSSDRAPHVCRNQRPEHRHRPVRAGRGRRVAARSAVGSGARHHPPRPQAGLFGGRHDRADCTADGARRRRIAAPEAVGRAGARRRPRSADAAAELREGHGADAAAHPNGALAAGRHPGGPAHEHHHHSRSSKPAPERGAVDRHAGSAAAAGRNRGAHHHHYARLRPPHRRAVGLQRPGCTRARQHDRPRVSEPGSH